MAVVTGFCETVDQTPHLWCYAHSLYIELRVIRCIIYYLLFFCYRIYSFWWNKDFQFMNAMSCATESCRFFHSSSSRTTTMSTPAVGRSNSRDLIIIGTPLEYRTFPPNMCPRIPASLATTAMDIPETNTKSVLDNPTLIPNTINNPWP